jgi:flagellar motor switch/type III secretory pathway protein FliN
MYWFVASGGSMTKAVANPRIGTLPLRVSVLVCGRTLSLDDLVHLQAGSIIPFSDQATSSLKLFAGDKAIGLGEAVTVDSKIAIRVTKLVKQSAIEQ